ncbi:MAG: hypothetical protein Ct9H90mP24_6080 [Methanobacteriota archaeon]|nr:MAG: hypothetical protein Ct9H90mP24_6080 [Euryarchaeota archaeon]
MTPEGWRDWLPVERSKRHSQDRDQGWGGVGPFAGAPLARPGVVSVPKGLHLGRQS